MFAVENFLYLSSKPLACMLFKSFVISLLMYCLPILYTSIYARDKKSLRKVFHDANNLGLDDVGDLDTIVKQPQLMGQRLFFEADAYYVK